MRIPAKVFNRIRLMLGARSVTEQKVSHRYERSFLKDTGTEKGHGSFFRSSFTEEDRKFININLNERQAIIDAADSIVEHKFDLLGSGAVNVDLANRSEDFKGIAEKFGSGKVFKEYDQIPYNPIDWHRDFKSSYRWDPCLWYKKITFGSIPGVDVKVPWELSRFNHSISLCQAYSLTGDEKYSREFVYQVLDWVESNPVEFGVNWACTMDVSIRLCNWLYAISFLRNSRYLTAGFWDFFEGIVYKHGRFIRENLEKKFMLPSTNHYIADLAGLVYAGVFFKNTDSGKNWLDFAINELKSEMDKQVYDDGCVYEASTCYHRLVLELMFFSTLLTIKSLGYSGGDYAEECRKVFGKSYTDGLYKMFDAVLHLLKPDGRMPQIGDNDSGRLHVLSPKDLLDMRYLLSFAAVFFNESRFKIKEFFLTGDCLWAFGRNVVEVLQDIKHVETGGSSGRIFPDSGWIVLRNDKDYLVVSSGPNGQEGIGGHAHNDKLGFEFFADGRDICIDTGTYLYTPSEEWRNNFRSTSSHNTIKIDGIEQNRFREGNVFLLDDHTMARINRMVDDKDFYLLEVQHHGYTRPGRPVIHKREFKFFKKSRRLEIGDILSGSGKHLVEVFFNIPGIPENLVDEDDLEIIVGDWRIYLSGSSKENSIKLEEVQGYYSPEYGIKIPCKRARYYYEAVLPLELHFVIEKFK